VASISGHWNQTSTATGVWYSGCGTLCRRRDIAFSAVPKGGRFQPFRLIMAAVPRLWPLPVFSFSKNPHPDCDFGESFMALGGGLFYRIRAK